MTAPITPPASDDLLRTGKPMWHGGTVHISVDAGATALCGVTSGRPVVAVITPGTGCDSCLAIAEGRV